MFHSFKIWEVGFVGTYLLVCSYSLHSITEKCLQMGWNCQNTLGSSVPYRILREFGNVLLFQDLISGFRGYLLACSYSLHSESEKFLEMGWNCQNTLGSSVPCRILRESICFTLSWYENWVSWVPTSSFRIICYLKTKKCLEMGWNYQNTLGSSVPYRILRESKCFTLSRYEKWVSWVPTSLFRIICFWKPKNVSKWVEIIKIRYEVVFLIAYFENRNVLLFQDMRSGFRGYLLVCFVLSAFENRKMSRNGLKLSEYVRK